MKYSKVLGVPLLLVGVFLVTFSATILLISKYAPSFGNGWKAGAPGTETAVKQFSGVVVLAYAEKDEYFLNLKSWDVKTQKYIPKYFVGKKTLDLNVKESGIAGQPASQSALQKIKITELKVNDEVQVIYHEAKMANTITSITRLATGISSTGTAFGMVTGVSEKRLNLDSNREMFSFGIENNVRVGPKFKTVEVNGKTVTRLGETTVEKNFNLVKPMSRVEILYDKSDTDLLIAKTILVLD